MVPETQDAIKAARGMLQGSGLMKTYLKEKNLEKLRIKNASLLTGDPEFRHLEKDGVLKLTWLD